MAWRVLRREPDQPWTGANHKCIRRLWRPAVAGRGPAPPGPDPQTPPRDPVPGRAVRAERPNQVWAVDFQFDETADGRRLKLANIVDEHTREALAMRFGGAVGQASDSGLVSP